MLLSRSDLLRMLLEGLMVLIGVFLALLADEWREERQLAHEARAAQVLLEDEILNNHRQLVDFRIDVADRYARIRSIGSALDRGYSLDRWSGCYIGYRFTQMRDAAWTRASLDRIGSRLPAGYMDAAAGLYSWNTTLESLGEQVHDLIYSPAYFDAAATEIAWRMAERIVWQQRRWAEVMEVEYLSFAETHAPTLLPQMQSIRGELELRWEAQLAQRATDLASVARCAELPEAD